MQSFPKLLKAKALCVCQICAVLHYFENTERNGIETGRKQPDLRRVSDCVAHAKPAGTPRDAGEPQKRQSQPRTVGFEFWWWSLTNFPTKH
jgi:hypothetical protein